MISRLTTPLAAAAIGLAAAIGPSAQAMSFSFVQNGFADGATLSGSFSGHDEDGDGWLYAYELDTFSLHFSGNRAVEPFSHGMDNRAGLVFDIAERALLHMASNGPGDSRFLEYDAFGWPGYHIPGRVTDNRSGLISISWDALQVTPVPEPGSLALLAAGLGVVCTAARRRADVR